jgi:hypothetical protein
MPGEQFDQASRRVIETLADPRDRRMRERAALSFRDGKNMGR